MSEGETLSSLEQDEAAFEMESLKRPAMRHSKVNDASSSSHTTTAEPTMSHVKQVFAIRHGESVFNIMREQNPSEDESYPDLYVPDCGITEQGIIQSHQAGKELERLLSGRKAFALIISPLRRALLTARYLLESGAGLSPTKTIVNPSATEVFMESCDIGSTPEVLQKEFPEFTFPLLQPDNWWPFHRPLEEAWELMRQRHPEGIETEEMIERRLGALREYIHSCSEEIIVVVCHSDIIYYLTKNNEQDGTWMDNGEILDVSEFI